MVWGMIMACPQMIVQLYRGLMKLYVNQMNVFKRQHEHKDDDQAAGLEIAKSSVYFAAIKSTRHTKKV
jgi:hypothetical protein